MPVTLLEAGLLSKEAYGDMLTSLPGALSGDGWVELDMTGYIANFADGYYGRAFVKVVDGEAVGVVIAHGGTEITESADLKDDIQIYLGQAVSQVDDAIAFKNAVSAAYTGFLSAESLTGGAFSEVLTNAGHSLGGYLAIRTADDDGADGRAIGFDNPKTGLTSTDATITNVLNDPNYINTAGSGNHLGTVLRVDSDRLLELDGEITFSNFLGRIANSVIDGTYAPSAYLDLLTSQTILQLAPTAYVGGIFAAQTLSEHSIDDINSRLAAAYTESYEGYNTTENVLLKAYLLGEYESSSVLGGIGEDFWDEFLDGNSLGITEDEFADEWLNYLDDVEFDPLDATQYVYLGSSGADSIVGNAADKFIFGRGGSDTIQIGRGVDLVSGGDGDDTYQVVYSDTGAITITDFDLGDDQLDLSRFGAFSYNLQTDATEAGGDTTLHFLDSEIVLENVAKTDLFNPTNNAFTGLIGGTAGNTLYGNSSGNTLSTSSADIYSHYATANNDTFYGNQGNDNLYGGAGNDTYIWQSGDGADGMVENEGETNIWRFEGVTASQFYLTAMNGYPFSMTGRVSTDGGSTVSGSMSLWNQNTGTSAVEIRYIILDDVVYDMTKGVVYRAMSSYWGETIEASPWFDANDTMYGSASSADQLKGYGGDDWLIGGGGNNLLYGGNGSDTLEGWAGVDTLYGEANDDTLEGGAGNDALYGGTGNDTYVWRIGDGVDGVVENEGETNSWVLDGVTDSQLYLIGLNDYPYTLTARVSTDGGSTVNGSIGLWNQNAGTSAVEIRYIVLDDVTYDTHEGMHYRAMSSYWGETIEASPWYDANDTMEASASSNDVLKGYGGNDSLVGGGGNNNLYGGNGNDSLLGGVGADSLYGDAGNDSLRGGADNDALYGGDGNDTLNGDAGADGLVGGNGDDTYIVNAGEGNTSIYDYASGNVIDFNSAVTFTNSGNDRTFTITATGETVFVDDFNLYTWSTI